MNESDLFKQDDEGKTKFHIACMQKNIKIINECLETKSDLLYLSDLEGNTGVHYLAINHYDDLLLKIVKNDGYYLKLKNNEDKYIYNIVVRRPKLLKEILQIMFDNKYHKYIEEKYDKDNTFILKIITLINDKKSIYYEILLFLNKNKISFNTPKNKTPLYYAIFFKQDVADFMIENIKNLDINITNTRDDTPLLLSIYKKYEHICIKLIKHGCDINYSGREKKDVPVSFALKNEMYEVVNEIVKRKDFDYNNLDNKLNTPIYYLIEKYEQNKKKVDNLLKTFVINSNLSNLNRLNITPLHLLLKYNLWIDLKKELLNKEFDINILDIYKNTPLSLVDEKNFYEFIEFLEQKRQQKMPITIDKEISIILPTTEHTDNGVWNAYWHHQILYLTYLFEKYNDLVIPIQHDDINKFNMDDYKMSMLKNNASLTRIVESYESYTTNFYDLSPLIFCWSNKNINLYAENLKFLIRRSISSQKRFLFIYCLIVQDTFNHANAIIYDKQTNTLMRFEPYGDYQWYDSDDLDNTIKELFEKSLKKQVEYFKPKDYLTDTKFQIISEEKNSEYTRLNDPIGFCMAWSYWFVELKMLNPDIPNNKLFKTALKKINTSFDKDISNPILSHIRNYANHLDKQKNIILQKAGIDKEEYYIQQPSQINIKKIYNYAKNTILNKIF